MHATVQTRHILRALRYMHIMYIYRSESLEIRKAAGTGCVMAAFATRRSTRSFIFIGYRMRAGSDTGLG